MTPESEFNMQAAMTNEGWQKAQETSSSHSQFTDKCGQLEKPTLHKSKVQKNNQIYPGLLARTRITQPRARRINPNKNPVVSQQKSDQ